MLFNLGQPLSIVLSGQTDRSFNYLSTDEVRPFLGAEPFFGQDEREGDLIAPISEDVKHSPLESIRHRGAPVVFLGLHEPGQDTACALPTSEFAKPELALQKLNGVPYFALDVAELDLAEEEINNILHSTLSKDGRTFSWAEPRSLMMAPPVNPFTTAVFASARSMLDWNYRNKFCPGCGSPTYSMWGGWKIACRTLLPWANNDGRKPCPSGKGLHNYTHPRTDSVVIMIAIDESGDKVLLGRGRRYPGKFYSALAGFIEPGESFEDAVAREMWEEAGVHVWNVKYHSGQPWPYPASLMVGFYARADASKPIRVDLDNELVDARWFSKDDVRAVIDHKAGTQFRKADYKRMNDIVEGNVSEDKEKPGRGSPVDDLPFRLPPMTAIAGVLLRDWVDGKLGFGEPLIKGNL